MFTQLDDDLRPGLNPDLSFRVEEDITTLRPHRPGRAQFTHPVPHFTDSLTALN